MPVPLFMVHLLLQKDVRPLPFDAALPLIFLCQLNLKI